LVCGLCKDPTTKKQRPQTKDQRPMQLLRSPSGKPGVRIDSIQKISILW
jgi:hypothetical protein